MSGAAEQARKYLQEKNIPILFESLMTALMYHKPDDPVDFMLRGLSVVKNNPDHNISWDMFIDTPPPPMQPPSRTTSAAARRLATGRLSTANEEPVRRTPPPKTESRPATATATDGEREATPVEPEREVVANTFIDDSMKVPEAHIVLLFGGPGGRKSVVGEEVAKQLTDEGDAVVHVSVPDAIRIALEKHKNFPEWQEATLKYEAGQPVPDNLALNVVKAELSKARDAKVIILDGYPRTLRQVTDLESELKRPVLAIIIDFDEDTLRKDLEHKEMSENVIASLLHEYRHNALPAAKHYDDGLILHLIAGEQNSDTIVDQFKEQVKRVMHKTTNGEDAFVAETKPETANGDEARLPPRDVPVVVVIGAPGSLKTEYCRRLVKRYDGFIHLNMGELLKQRAEADDDDGKEMNNYLSNGELVPNALCGDLIFKAMHEFPNSWGFVLEGYPRDTTQAEEFDGRVDRIDLVLLIDCTEQFCLTNLRDRLNGDDDAGRSRIAGFKQHTLPMLKHYDEKGKLKVVEGDRGLDEVFQDVIQALDGVFIPQESADGKSLSNAEES